MFNFGLFYPCEFNNEEVEEVEKVETPNSNMPTTMAMAMEGGGKCMPGGKHGSGGGTPFLGEFPFCTFPPKCPNSGSLMAMGLGQNKKTVLVLFGLVCTPCREDKRPTYAGTFTDGSMFH